MLEGFKPMLSAKIESDTDDLVLQQLSKLAYPLIASPKVDGIRIVVHPELGAVSRTLKAVPNQHIFQTLFPVEPEAQKLLAGLDGEITFGPPDFITNAAIFNLSQSAVMTYDGYPNFTYWVFDDFTNPQEPYNYRQNDVEERVDNLGLPWLKALEHSTVNFPTEVITLEQKYLERGFEGIMLRYPNAPYKYGRSTLKQQHLIKLKRRGDAEGTVIGSTPLYRNTNAPEMDNLGHQKRSSHKAGKVADELLGTLVVKPDPASGFSDEFEIGSGFDVDTRTRLWRDREALIGLKVSFKYQVCGVKDKPRFPIFKGFRSD